uniref:Small subunit processome component 20 homolog n=1 Tax=Saccoglossus kowalevskii TaxID=10224 RepID=A0ABM0MIE2_SACKO|nr:PREDICTED: small subunit processome component 20 homolog [Saccoglossus kowalevskii]
MMKRTSKSAHHQNENRYTFQTFSERLSQINIDVIRKGKRQIGGTEDCDSHFVDGFLQWRELNCTVHFANFSKEIARDVTTYAQVVHHKEKIINALKTHLQIPNSLAYKPLLDLVVQLSKDLQIDFYPYFQSFFDIIVELLNNHPQDTELLEDAFQCLGYLFKFLWRYLLKDIQDVFLFYSPLLGSSKKDYVRRFAAESFAFLLRKLKDFDKMMYYILHHMEEKTELCEGVGKLFFEMMKGVKTQFHSSAEKYFSVLLCSLGSADCREDLNFQLVYDCLFHTVTCMAKHSKRQSTSFVAVLLTKRATHLKNLTLENSEVFPELQSVLKLLQVWIKQKGTSMDTICILPELLDCGNLSSDVIDDILALVSAHIEDDSVSFKDKKELLTSVYGNQLCTFHQINMFTHRLLTLNNFDELALPCLMEYFNKDENPTNEKKTELLFLLTKVITNKRTLPQSKEELTAFQQYQLNLNRLENITSIVEQLLILSETMTDVLLSTQDKGVTDLMTVVLCQLFCTDDGIFKVCLDAETEPITLQSYRERLRHLQQLMFIPRHRYARVPLLYLLGSLYINLSLIWNPVLGFIKTLAYEMERDEFFHVYTEHLKSTTDKLEDIQSEDSVPALNTSEECNTVSDLLVQLSETCFKQDDKPDHYNHRHLLLKAMATFADKAEGKSRILTPVFLHFIQKEYEPTDHIVAPTEDLRAQSTVNKRIVTKKERKLAIKSLIDYMSVFSKFKDPKSLYQESTLRELYLKLLCHPDTIVQQLSLNCLLSYKYKYLVPYQENLQRLLVEKSFRAELVAFSLDEDNAIVQNDHREQLFPLLMRVLYGRMLNKSGGKSKKSHILRFIAGCQSSELSHFIQLILEPIDEWVKEKNINLDFSEESFKLQSFVPLKKLQSVIEVCGLLLSNLYHVLEPYLSLVLHSVLQITSRVSLVLEQRDLVHIKYVKPLRKLRQLGVDVINQFFQQCELYEYSDIELQGLYGGIVWPVIQRLTQECLYSPTAVLKLAFTWTQHQRLHPLLVYYPDDKLSLQVLGQIMELLSNKQIDQSVTTMIIDMIDNLLPIQDDDDDITDTIYNFPPKYIKTDAFCSECVLRPYILTVLQYLRQVVQEKTNRKKNQKCAIPMKELHILSKLSTFVSDGQESYQLIDILLPILRQIPQEKADLLLEILGIVKKLIIHCKNPQNFLRPLSKLLSWLSTTPSRSLCCDIITLIGAADEKVAELCQLIVQLNKVDRRRLEEPDYTVRISAYTKISSTVTEMDYVDLNYIIPIMHNCFYFISKVDDMSLRDNSSNILQIIIERISKEPSDKLQSLFELCVNQMIIPAIKEGLGNKMENVRHEYILLLTKLVKYFPNKFQDLQVLHDKDIEKDFFKNITHIQQHRQMRALRLVAQKCETKELGTYVLQTFLLPLATSVIFDANLSKNHQLVLDATLTIGAITKCLPWQPYIKVLKYYLGLLMTDTLPQKMTVRLLANILDSFHFDLTNYKPAMKTNPKDVDEGCTGNNDETVTEQAADESKYNTIINKILPKLEKCLTQKVDSDDEHRSVRSHVATDTEIVRIPLAIAIIRLLLALPVQVRYQHIQRVVLKLCHSLKSRSSDIRESSRTTLIKVMSYLGTEYIKNVIGELQHTLTRGYQKHVLTFTINAVLQGISDGLKPGDLDTCVDMLIQICNDELFGQIAEEKEAAAITRNLMEARSSKSYDIYHILSKYISATHLTKLISAIKTVLDNTHSHKTVKKVEDVLRKFTLGLLENKSLDAKDILLFIHGIVTQTLPFMIKDTQEDKKSTKSKHQQHSVLLLPQTPQRKPKATVHRKTNLHVLVEFGLQVIIGSVQSLSRLIQYSLPQLNDQAGKLAGLLFQLLKTYGRSGTPKGDNLHLVQWCFKTMTMFLKNMQRYKLTEDQLQVLLSFVEEDIYDTTRQSTAFPLLKAMLSRKLQCKEIETVMEKVAELSIISEANNIQVQCRQLMSQFLLDYPLGKKIRKYLEFYVSQLTYEYEGGRKSTLEMLAAMFSIFPQNLLDENSGLFFVPMASSLANDNSVECRKLIALAIKTLLSKEEVEDKEGDHLLFNLLTCFGKILQNCAFIMKAKTHETVVKKMWVHIHSHILHNHSWVRLAVSQLYGQMFTIMTIDDVFHYCGSDLISQLVQDFCKQLHSKITNATLVDQDVKNLVFLGKLIDQHHDSDDETNLAWLMSRLTLIQRYERANTTLGKERRTGILKWIAGMSVYFTTDQIIEHLPVLLEIVHKELQNPSRKDVDLRTLAQEVVDILRSKVDVTVFTAVYTKVKISLEGIKIKRHQQEALEAVADPERAAKKKMRKNIAKKESKKRKIFERKPYKNKKFKK